MQIMLQPAFVLHSRPYRETSLLIDLFTQELGRIALIARGVRMSRSPLKALLQPFNPLLVSWKGKTELMTLTAAEPNGLSFQLRGDCLLSGFYLNEILIRVLQKQDPHPNLYTTYWQTLIELQAPILEQKILRLFEKKLLQELGYGLQLDQDIMTGEPISAEKYYRFLPERGFELSEKMSGIASDSIFCGKNLISFAQDQLHDRECLQEIKRLMRLVLTPLLGPRPLYSRKLFQ